MVRKIVTGMGAVNAAGDDVDGMMRTLYRGTAPSYSHAEDHFLRAPVGDSGKDKRVVQLLSLCAEQALIQARLDPSRARGLRIGVSLGTTTGTTLVDTVFGFAFYGDENPHPQPFDAYLGGNPAQIIARKYDLSGPVVTINNACTSGADAIGIGCSWLDNDSCDIVIAGGGDQILDVIQSGFSSLQLVAGALCRPFDIARDGLTLGEGAGILVIEKERPGCDQICVGEICGYGLASDGYHPTSPDPAAAGLKLAIDQALAQAGLTYQDIGSVNAHGTGTTNNDLIEGRLLATLFPHAPFYSIKGYTGHTLGGAGAIEAIATLRSLIDGLIPVSAGFTLEDPAIGVSPTVAATRSPARYALSTSIGFGGAASSLVLGVGRG